MNRWCSFWLGIALVGAGAHAEWPTFHGSTGLTGYADVALGPAPVRLWKTRVGTVLPSAVVGDAKRAFLVADGNRLVALEAATGKKVWEKLFSDADGPLAFHGAPLYIANAALVVVASSEGMVFAVSATDGAILWQTSTGAPIANSATFSGERIFVMNQISGAVQCLALEDGKKLWKSAKTERCDGSLSASDKHVFFRQLPFCAVRGFPSGWGGHRAYLVGAESGNGRRSRCLGQRPVCWKSLRDSCASERRGQGHSLGGKRSGH